MYKKYLVLVFIMCAMLGLTGCQTGPERRFDDRVVAHERLLREHFLGHYTGLDLAELINRTTNIANQLRGRGRLKDANRFDSYRDVLIYGQYTIDESINDVQKLIKDGVRNDNRTCFSFCVKNIFRCDE